MKFAVENTPAGKAIVVGLTHTNLQDVIALARHARDLDIRAGLLAARPFKREVRGGKSSITFFSQTES
jgi:dihydrodipicolinate synthase/N-acetylneuraminate lyase